MEMAAHAHSRLPLAYVNLKVKQQVLQLFTVYTNL
jgi:hypothetical protein